MASNLLDKLKSKAKTPTEKPAAKKKDRPVIDLRGDELKSQAQLVDRFAASDAIMKVAESAQEAAKGNVKTLLKDVYLRICIEKGFVPENPNVVTDNSKLNFIVKHVKKFKRTGTAGEVLSVADQLKALGFGDEVISEIEKKVIKEKTHLGLKRFTDLTDDGASPAQKAVAEKLMAFVAELTDDEQALVLEQTVETSVDEGWQDIAVGIAVKEAKGNVEVGAVSLAKLYSVIEPQFVCSQMQYTGKLDSALTDIQSKPVTLVRKVIDSPDKKFRAICNGDEMELYVLGADGKEGSLKGKKKCENAGHAEASAKKLFRDSSALVEFLAGA